MVRFGRESDGWFDPFTPRVEVVEKDGQLIVRADVAGIEREDLKVNVFTRELTIQGERKGYFFRSIPLPDGVDPARARTTTEAGVLEIVVPIERKAPGPALWNADGGARNEDPTDS
jgi:HSP20 family protein